MLILMYRKGVIRGGGVVTSTYYYPYSNRILNKLIGSSFSVRKNDGIAFSNSSSWPLNPCLLL